VTASSQETATRSARLEPAATVTDCVIVVRAVPL
jgi:hypothetical protein